MVVECGMCFFVSHFVYKERLPLPFSETAARAFGQTVFHASA